MNDFKRNDRFGGKRSSGGFGKKQFGRPSFDSRPQSQMYPAICAQCGRSTEVPFRPNGQRPVYCRDCFGGGAQSSSPAPMRDDRRPSFREPMPMPRSAVQAPVAKPDPRIDEIQKNLAKIQAKLDQILLSLAVSQAQATIVEAPVKKKTSAKKK